MFNENENYCRVRNHCFYTGKYCGAADIVCNLRYKTPKEFPAAFHNGSNYDYRFMIKELAGEFEGQFECQVENTEKYITFSVPIKKATENGNTITWKIKFIDNVRFMSSSLSNVFDNLSEGFDKDKCKNCWPDLEHVTAKDNTLTFECIRYSKSSEKKSLTKI